MIYGTCINKNELIFIFFSSLVKVV